MAVTEEKLAALKKDAADLHNQKIRADARMEDLKNQQRDLEKEIREAGLNPETLDQDIAKLDAEAQGLAEEILADIQQMKTGG